MRVKSLVTRLTAGTCTLLAIAAAGTAALGYDAAAAILFGGAACFYALTMYRLIELTSER